MKSKVKKWKIEVELWDGNSFLGTLKTNTLKEHIQDSLMELEGDLDIVPAKFRNLKIRRVK